MNSLVGYYTIPSADFNKDGTISIGTFYLPKKYVEKQNYSTDVLVYYGSITYVPFLELSLRFTKPIGLSDGLGDRMLCFKVRPIKESSYFPSIAFGLQDFFHSTESKSNRFNSIYIVATKNMYLKSLFVNELSITLGYGNNVIKAGSYQYQGVWGGIKVKLLKYLEVMIDNDAKYTSTGFRLNLFQYFNLLVGLIDQSELSGGVSINLSL